MPKYTYKDVIINPNDERLKDAIGKEVYYSFTIKNCINKANNAISTGKLTKIDEKSSAPFLIKTTAGLIKKDYIIIERELKTKYVPFDLSKEEDSDFLRGKWIKQKGTGNKYQIGMPLEGWHASDDTGKLLLEGFTFLDGSPVGKKVETMDSNSNRNAGEEK